ncbi:MAG TPA: hypothetical protein VM008_17240 [Phycisphaerae bacterium]|nr:hypothetical protein [Phycisphaerae bacterium]
MVINAVCGNCKRVYPVDEQYAGQTFTCETCGRPFTVPVPGVAEPVTPVGATRVPQSSQYFPEEPSRDRLMAGRICIVLSVLLYVGFTCIGCAGLVLLVLPPGAHQGGPPGAPLPIVGAVSLVMAVLVGGVATTYLVCGLKIRKGGRISAIVALVVASLHVLLIAIIIATAVFRQVLGGAPMPIGQFAIPLTIQLLFLLAVGQLLYHLVKILREPSA